jgi:hypothetical protein
MICDFMICVNIVKRNIIWADMILISWLGSMNHGMTKVIASNRDFYVILNIGKIYGILLRTFLGFVYILEFLYGNEIGLMMRK